jgi:hypothetical protein
LQPMGENTTYAVRRPPFADGRPGPPLSPARATPPSARRCQLVASRSLVGFPMASVHGPSTGSRVPDPDGSVADGNWLGGADRAVERLNSEGDLALLTGPGLGAQLEADQVFIPKHGRFCLIALPVSGGTLPADAAALDHEPDETVARILLMG